VRSLTLTSPHLAPFRRFLYSPATLQATLVEFSCRHLDAFRFIFSTRYRAFPFVHRSSISSLSFLFQSIASPTGEWKRPYINSVAEYHDNNDLTAVRSNIFYRKCSCSRFFVKIGSNDSRCWDHHIALFKHFGFSTFSPELFSFSFIRYSPEAPYLLAWFQVSVIGSFWRQLRDFSNRRFAHAKKNIASDREIDRVIGNLLIISFINYRFFARARVCVCVCVCVCKN